MFTTPFLVRTQDLTFLDVFILDTIQYIFTAVGKQTQE